jgi:coatomer subunit beta
MNKFANLRTVILEKLLESFSAIRSAKTHRAALWILGEFCTNSTDIQVNYKSL